MKKYNELKQPVFYVPGSMHLIDTVNPETMLSSIWGKSLEETRESSSGAVCMEFDEAIDQIMTANHAKYIDPKAKQIDEDQWYEMLNVLPPCKWGSLSGIEYFHVSERMTANIVSWFTSDDKGVFATFMDYATISQDRIIQRHLEAFELA